jgi:hypothetical protein
MFLNVNQKHNFSKSNSLSIHWHRINIICSAIQSQMSDTLPGSQ